MTPKTHKPPDARISERLRLCQENVDESPYSHPVAVGWYLQDVDHLFARLNREASSHHVEVKRLEEQLEAMRRENEHMWWFLRHRTAAEGITQAEVYEQINWSEHPEFASNPANRALDVLADEQLEAAREELAGMESMREAAERDRDGLQEQLEAAQEALREIASYEGFGYQGVEAARIARRALNPAKKPDA